MNRILASVIAIILFLGVIIYAITQGHGLLVTSCLIGGIAVTTFLLFKSNKIERLIKKLRS